jgi:TPR repeat protein
MSPKSLLQGARNVLAGIFVAATLATSAVADDYAKATQAYEAGRFATVIKLIEPLAKAGDPRAQHLLGRTYEWANWRDGVKRDLQKTQHWYEQAARQDYLPAKRSLGRMLAGNGINAKRGYRILLDLAKKGDAPAQSHLGAYLLRKADPDYPKKYRLP